MKNPGRGCAISSAPEKLEHILANVFTEHEFKNLRIAETEKYAHVTYFFNGGIEKPFPGEERIMVPSPKVPTYDLKPEMSAAGVADAVIHAIEKGDFDAIIMNFANADMVGHSGKLEATIKACETVDECLGRIFQALRPRGGAWIITADHGNAETMIDPSNGRRRTPITPRIPCRSFCSQRKAARNCRAADRCAILRRRCWAFWVWREPGEMTGRDLRVGAEIAAGKIMPDARRRRMRPIGQRRTQSPADGSGCSSIALAGVHDGFFHFALFVREHASLPCSSTTSTVSL